MASGVIVTVEISEPIEMSACTILSFPSRFEHPAAMVSRDWGLLDFLRNAALRARLEPQLEPERACALIAADPTVSAERHAVAFFRALARVSTRDLVLHHRGVRRATPDETWLEALITSLHRGDTDSAAMLMSGRIKALGRHRMFALTCGLATALSTLSLEDRSSLAS